MSASEQLRRLIFEVNHHFCYTTWLRQTVLYEAPKPNFAVPTYDTSTTLIIVDCNVSLLSNWKLQFRYVLSMRDRNSYTEFRLTMRDLCWNAHFLDYTPMNIILSYDIEKGNHYNVEHIFLLVNKLVKCGNRLLGALLPATWVMWCDNDLSTSWSNQCGLTAANYYVMELLFANLAEEPDCTFSRGSTWFYCWYTQLPQHIITRLVSLGPIEHKCKTVLWGTSTKER